MRPGGATRSLDELEAEVKEVLSDVESTKTALKDVEELLASVAGIGDAEDKDLAAYRKTVAVQEKRRLDAFREQLKKVEGLSKDAEARASRRRYGVLEPLRFQVALCAAGIMQARGQTPEQFFEQVASGADALGCEAFVAFVRSLATTAEADELPEVLKADKLDDEQMGKLFKHLAGESENISKECFLDLVLKAVFRVTKSTILTEENSVISKNLRRLEERELVDALTYPKLDDDTGVTRFRCRARDDGTEGWATLAGNKGTSFLNQCSRFLWCVKDTVMSEEQGADTKTVHNLTKGEVVEVLDFDSKDAKSGMRRLRCKLLPSGEVGWVNYATSKGEIFLESC